MSRKINGHSKPAPDASSGGGASQTLHPHLATGGPKVATVKLAAALIAAVMLVGTARADEPTKYYLGGDGQVVAKKVVEHDQRIAALEKELAALKAGPVKVATAGPVCPCGAACCVAGERPAVKASGGYPYPDHVASWYGVRIDDTAAGVAVARFADEFAGLIKSHGINSARDAIYLNGERYDPSGAYRFRNPQQDELTTWYAWTGPCRLLIKGGAYHFESLTGTEEATRSAFGTGTAWRAEWESRDKGLSQFYASFDPRLRTMTDCRRAWAEWDRKYPTEEDGRRAVGAFQSGGGVSAAAPSGTSAGTLRTNSGRMIVPTGNGAYRYADESPSVTPAGYLPSYQPTYSLPSGPAQSCPGGRCPIR